MRLFSRYLFVALAVIAVLAAPSLISDAHAKGGTVCQTAFKIDQVTASKTDHPIFKK